MTTRDDVTNALDAYVSDAVAQQKASDQATIDELTAEVADLKAQLGEQTPIPDPEPTTDKRVSVYMSGNNKDLGSYLGKQPNLMSFYLNWNSTGLPSTMTTAARAGATIQVEFGTNSKDIYWKDVANGKYDTWLKGRLSALSGLGVPVWVTMDNEPDAKIKNGKIPSGQTPAQYVAAVNHVADLANNYKNLEPLVWLAGFGSASSVEQFLPDKSRFSHIGWDPYKTGSHKSENATELFSTLIENVLVPNGWGDVRRHICETGIMVEPFSGGGSYSVTEQKDFYKGIPAAMDANNIESVVIFRSNSGAHDYIPLDSSVDTVIKSIVTT